MKLFLLGLLVLLFGAPVFAQQTIDTEKSVVKFEWFKHEREGSGSLMGLSGTVQFDSTMLDSAQMNVKVAMLMPKTGMEKLDHHLQQSDYFDIANYPVIKFESDSVSRKEDSFVVIGKMIFKGIEKQIEIPFTVNNNGLSGRFTVSRNDYDLGGASFAGREDIITVTINCVLKN